jgi:putative hydrolase of HD superfamily
MENKDILNFIFELGQLRRIDHEGWKLIGINHPETVAEHSLRAAQIGFILAKLEKCENPLEVPTILIFHDLGECRIGDIHRVANRYVKAKEETAVKEQTGKLNEIGKEILDLWKQAEYRNTKAGIIAKDADMLEQAVTGKEYLEKGFNYAQDWINNISKGIKTESAKKLLEELKTSDSNLWWQGLKKLKNS